MYMHRCRTASHQSVHPWKYAISTHRSLRWRHNGCDGVSYHQPYDCLFNRLFRRRSKKTSKHRVTGFCAGIHRGPVNSPHKWPVTRKMSPFDDVIMVGTEWAGATVRWHKLDTLGSRQDGRYFADDIINCTFMNENACILMFSNVQLTIRQHCFG